MIKRKGINFQLCIGSFLLGFSVSNVIRVWIGWSLTRDRLSLVIHALWATMFITGLMLVLSGFLAHKRLDKLQEKGSIKRKEAEAGRRRAEADLLATPIAGLDTPPVEYDPLLGQYIGQQAPTYVPPADANNDPYTAKPQGFNNQQAAQGYPKQPAQTPLQNPFDDLA